MSFLNPAFLWAITAISIPIIIHLINFRRHKTLYFSNTKYLIDIKKETKNKTQLKQLLILLCRILTIIMLVIVFAGPFIPFDRDRETDKLDVTAIYIDNSFSMQAEAKSGQLFDVVRQNALEIVNSAGSGMKFILITNENKPEHQVILNKEQITGEIEKLKIAPYQISLDELVLKINTLTPQESKANLYILSDMQKNFIETPSTEVNENIDLIFMQVEGTTVNNIFIDTCYFETPVHRLGQQEKLIVRIRSFSNEDNFDIPLQLFINDSLKAFAGVNIKANETTDVELDYINTVSGHISARLEITDYPITYDNTMFFDYYIADKIRILLINGMGENRYIKSLYNSDPDNFEITSVRQGGEQSLVFGSYDFIILNEISEISSGLAAEIRSFIDEGGSVSFIPAKDLDYVSCNNFLALFNAGKIGTDNSESAKINYLDYEHRIFIDVFQRREKQVDLPGLGFIHAYSPYSASAPAIIVRTENQMPVLTSYEIKKGTLYVFSLPLYNNNVEFLRHPLFVPIFYNMALNSQLNNPLYAVLEAGAEYEIISFGQISENELIKITGNDKPEIIPQHRFTGSSLSIFIPEELDKAGNYKVMSGNNKISGLSVNYDRSESEAVYYTHEDLKKLADGKYGDNAVILSIKQDSFYQAIKEMSIGKLLWRYFLILALFFIICEILVIRLMK